MYKALKTILILILIFIAGSFNKVNAQLGLDPNNYTYLSYQLGSTNFVNGAKSGILPSVSEYNGYSSYLQNPAVMAMASESDFTFSLINNNINEESTFLGNSLSTSENVFRTGEIGFVYKVPTYQGSFVIGAGYTTTNVFNRVDNAIAFNSNSSITDYFAEPESGFETLAFETFAADFQTQSSADLTSIFRLDGPFQGIDQDVIRKQRGRTGNYSAFGSVEFAQNLFAGVSLGYTYGVHRYDNSFLETDGANNYNRAIIPSDVSGQFTDVESLEFGEDLESVHYGLDIRGGLVYDLDLIKLGASFYLPFKMRVQEDYYTFLQNNLDDGSEPFFFEEEFGTFRYRIDRPVEYQLGISTGPIAGIELSASARYRDAGSTEVDFITDAGDAGFLDRRELLEQQNRVNEEISAIFRSTIDYRFGLNYDLSDFSNVYGGYAYSPSPVEDFDMIRTQFSGGFEYEFSFEWAVIVGGQYTVWNDRSTLYEFDSNGSVVREETSLRSQAFNLMAGIRYTFR